MGGKEYPKDPKTGLPNYPVSAYAQYYAAGALCATITHGAVTPLDVIKTRIQVDPQYAKQGLLSAGRGLVANEGASILLTGFGATAAGYLVQGGAKFAGFEYAKKKLIEYQGGYEAAVPKRGAIYIAGASAAEFVADIFLTPLEAVRIRLVSQKGYANGLGSGFVRMFKEDGVRGLYSGFIPILAKQIPYAVGQFTVNEFAHEQLAKALGPQKTEQMNSSVIMKPVGDLGCGIFAGAAAAIFSQPGDTLLSQINKGGGGKGGALKKLVTLGKEMGFAGMFAGLGPRIVMTAGLVSGQFLIYGACKDAFGAPPGVEIHKT